MDNIERHLAEEHNWFRAGEGGVPNVRDDESVYSSPLSDRQLNDLHAELHVKDAPGHSH